MKKLLNWEVIEMTPEEIIELEIMQEENNLIEKKQELNDIETQMKSLNADRKNLQDLIELELQAEWDIEAYESITLKLNELANKRKELKSK